MPIAAFIALIVALAVLLAVMAVLVMSRRAGRIGRSEPRGPRAQHPGAPSGAPGMGVPTALKPEPPGAAVRAELPTAPGLAARIRNLFRGGEATEQTWRDLEEALIRADVGPSAGRAIVARVREAYRSPLDPVEVVVQEVARTFGDDQPWSPPTGSPGIIMIVGVNGAGKTTTIGKLAHLLTAQGLSVSLANSDTFRAAAGEQLGTWASRSNVHVVAQERGGDPGAVAFDAVNAARARGSDVLIVDTAGRLHTRQPLMEELAKVKRVLEKASERAVEQVLLVLDATTGQNGIAQARAFTEAVDVTGVVLAKMDGTAKGGIVLAVREDLGVPVVLVGVGERAPDLIPFDPDGFARRLVA
jgi:fused signal recognition particle receptor